MQKIKKQDIRKRGEYSLSNFIVQFPLKTELYQEDILNKRFEIGRKIYNSLKKKGIIYLCKNRT